MINKLPMPSKYNFKDKAMTIHKNSTKCKYIDKYNNKCQNTLKIYPKYCKMHTIMNDNLYIDKSKISFGGNGLFAGPIGFKKGDVIGIYSNSETEVKLGDLYKRCNNYKEKDNCWEYVFCKSGHRSNTKCWDNLDIRSGLMRYINDAHNTKYKNNAFFEVKNNKAYVIASKNIREKEEIFVDYGKDYWN